MFPVNLSNSVLDKFRHIIIYKQMADCHSYNLKLNVPPEGKYMNRPPVFVVCNAYYVIASFLR
jgi:hypothetical protein